MNCCNMLPAAVAHSSQGIYIYIAAIILASFCSVLIGNRTDVELKCNAVWKDKLVVASNSHAP